MTNKPFYLVSQARGQQKILEFARYLSPTETFSANLWPELSSTQCTLANKECLVLLKKSQGGSLTSHLKKRGTCFDLAFTSCPGGAGIQPGPMALRNDLEMTGLNATLISLYNKILELAFPDREKEAFAQSWAAEGSLTIGEDNVNVSSIQVNFSRLDEAMEKGLKCKAHIHIDKNDDPTRLSIVLFLSKFPMDVFPGRFNITSAGLTCSAETFGALVFTGRHPHCGSGVGRYPESLPSDSKLRAQLPDSIGYPELDDENYPDIRINAILYPRRDCMKQGATPLRRLSDGKALGAFVTQRAQREFEVRQFIKHNIGTDITIDKLQKVFSWQNAKRETLYPRRWIIELALKYSGTRNQELADRHEAALVTGCGDKLPADEETKKKRAEDIKRRKEGKKMRRETALARGKVQCMQYIARRKKQCEGYFYPKDEVLGCKRHPEAGLLPAATKGIDAVAGSRKRKLSQMEERFGSEEEYDLLLNDDSYDEAEFSSDESDMEWGTEDGDCQDDHDSVPKYSDVKVDKDDDVEMQVDYPGTTPMARSNNRIAAVVTSKSSPSSSGNSTAVADNAMPQQDLAHVPVALLKSILSSVEGLRRDVAQLTEQKSGHFSK